MDISLLHKAFSKDRIGGEDTLILGSYLSEFSFVDDLLTFDISDLRNFEKIVAKGDLYVAGKLNIVVNYAGINDQGTDKTGKIIGKDKEGRPFTENQRTIDSIGEINLVSDGSANQNIIGEITATTPNAKESSSSCG